MFSKAVTKSLKTWVVRVSFKNKKKLLVKWDEGVIILFLNYYPLPKFCSSSFPGLSVK